MRHVFIINPASGKGKHLDSTRAAIERAAEDAGIRAEIYVTQFAGDGERYAREVAASAAEEPVRVYACGGDGTLNEVLNGVYGAENVELASIPVGSGNDFVKNFPEPEAFLDVSRQIEGEAQALDVILCNGRCCLNLANIGFDSEVCRRMGSLKKLPFITGKGAYTLAVAVTFIQKMGQRLKAIFPDGEVSDGLRILTAIGNGVCYGGGYYATPEASLTDGLMDVAMISKLSRLKILRLIGEYKAGRHLHHPGFKPYLFFRRARAFRIEADAPLSLCVDGEIRREGTTIDFQIGDSPIYFILPSSGGETAAGSTRTAPSARDAKREARPVRRK